MAKVNVHTPFKNTALLDKHTFKRSEPYDYICLAIILFDFWTSLSIFKHMITGLLSVSALWITWPLIDSAPWC